MARLSKREKAAILLIGIGKVHDLGPAGLKKSVLVIATSDQPALLRLKAPLVGTSIAEYFRDHGYNVLLLMDSLTRFCMAQREVGMAVGEPPISRGYTPSVYSILPKLLERSGASDKGTITGLYTVLVEGDDMNEPIADTARGILDGHIVLTRSLASANHYPAIDVLQSVSRLMKEVATKEHSQKAGELRNALATYRDSKDLIQIGAYKQGTDPNIDRAIDLQPKINKFLCQMTEEAPTFDEVVEQLLAIHGGQERLRRGPGLPDRLHQRLFRRGGRRRDEERHRLRGGGQKRHLCR